MITVVTQYTGNINLLFADNPTDAQTVLNQYEWVEKKILRELLGDDLYLTFIENIAQLSGKYYDLKNGVTSYTISDGTKAIFNGIKDMLPYFVFFYVKRDKNNTVNTVGDYVDSIENAEKQDNKRVSDLSINAYNIGIDKYIEVYNYIEFKNSETADYYPNFDHTCKRHINKFGI